MNPLRYVWMRVRHMAQHRNRLFYTLSPELTIAIHRAFEESRMSDSRGAYYEFGIFKGYNLWFAHNIHPAIECFGFDSFEGMPISRGAHPHHARGQYSASVEEVKEHLFSDDSSRVHLIKLWFGNGAFDGLMSKTDFPPVKIAVVDCDLYVSTVPVLRFLGPLLRTGSILLFDEWRMDSPNEEDAAREFLSRNPKIKFVHMFDFGIYGRAFVVRKGR